MIEDTIRTIVRDELERFGARVGGQQAGAPTATASLEEADDCVLGKTAAEKLSGLSWETIKKLMRQGTLTRYGTPRAARVSKNELLAYIEMKTGAKSRK